MDERTGGVEWICTASFSRGKCSSECQWFHGEGCPCAKGSKKWDGKTSIAEKLRREGEGKEEGK